MKKTKVLCFIMVLTTVLSLFCSCGATKKAMEYKDKSISVNMYSYWQSQVKSNYISSSNDTPEYWSTKISDEETYADRMKAIVDMNVMYNLVTMSLFDEFGLSLSLEKTAEIEEKLNDLIESYGSKSLLNQALSAYNINADILKEIYTVEAKGNAVYEYLYGENGKRLPSSDDLFEYFKENYYHCDVIIVFTAFEYAKDENGNLIISDDGSSYKTNELTSEQKQEKNDKIEKIKSLLDGGADFAGVQAEYNEDMNADKYQQGYYLSANEVSSYGSEMIISLQEMNVGEYKVITDENATYIIKKEETGDFKPYDDENYSSMIPNFRGYWCSQNFAEYVDEFTDDIVVYEENIAEYPIENAVLMGSNE